jgi:hypothetical protein
MRKIDKLFLFGCTALLMISLIVKYAQENTALANPVTPPALLKSPSLAEMGIQLVDISLLPASQFLELKSSAIEQSRAIGVANSYSAVRPEQVSSVIAKLYLFTDSHHGPVDYSGQVRPLYQNRLVWIVTYKGEVSLLSGGPPDGPHDSTNAESNVVVDAVTGEYLEGFSYK